MRDEEERREMKNKVCEFLEGRGFVVKERWLRETYLEGNIFNAEIREFDTLVVSLSLTREMLDGQFNNCQVALSQVCAHITSCFPSLRQECVSYLRLEDPQNSLEELGRCINYSSDLLSDASFLEGLRSTSLAGNRFYQRIGDLECLKGRMIEHIDKQNGLVEQEWMQERKRFADFLDSYKVKEV